MQHPTVERCNNDSWLCKKTEHCAGQVGGGDPDGGHISHDIGCSDLRPSQTDAKEYQIHPK